MTAVLGFIGLGRMGLPMTRHLAAAGNAVRVFDTAPAALAAALAFDGVRAEASPKAVAAACDVLFTCLPNNQIVEATYGGAEGIGAGARPGLITCDCSTVSPDVAERTGQVMRQAGGSHLDTPMLGSQPQAESGEIFFIVSGQQDAYRRIADYLGLMGKQSMFVGGSGSANKIKLIHNALGAINAVAVAETLSLCVVNGVDLRAFHDVVRSGGGMAFSTYFDRRVARIIAGDYSPTFTVELMRKDVSLAMELAGNRGRLLEIMGAAKAAYDEAVDGGWGEEDFSGVSHVIEQRLRLKLSGQ